MDTCLETLQQFDQIVGGFQVDNLLVVSVETIATFEVPFNGKWLRNAEGGDASGEKEGYLVKAPLSMCAGPR